MNYHVIKLVDNRQLNYRPLYNLRSVELETLKIYFKTNLCNGFIRPFKSPERVLIFFDKKLDGSFQLCVDYWEFNNLTIKNQYLLPFVEKSSDQLRQA